MARSDSDSSSNHGNESSSDEEEIMDTDSVDAEKDGDACTSNSALTPKKFSLPTLGNKDKLFQHKIFDAYLQNATDFSKDKKSFLIDRTVENIQSNFTPWWESWTTIEKHSGQSSSAKTNESSDEPIFNNWFQKSCHGSETSNWLCGPKPQSLQEKSATVDDIVVPSIYGNVSHAKGRRALKKERKEQRNKTTGKKWFDMKLPDVDSNTKMDMELLQMRRALDPKRFYKQNDRRGLPKYFQMGTVVDEGTDFYSSRLTKKQRKQTLVEELMADVNVRKYNKKKYGELQQKQRTKKFSKKTKT